MDEERLSPETVEEVPTLDPNEVQGGIAEDPVTLRKQIEEFRRRNSGLQRRLQQELQTRRELESRLRDLEEMVYAQGLQSLPVEERMRRLQEFRTSREIEERERRIRELEAQMEYKAKVLVAQELSRETGAPVEELMAFDTPEEMERFARSWGRRSRGVGRFEGSETAPSPRTKPRTLDEAVDLFRREARRRGL